MKLQLRFSLILAAAFTLISAGGCKKLLVEQPRAQLTPEFFATPGGIEGGIAAAYSDFRNLWGTENFANICVGGTDEVLAGGSNNNLYLFTYSALLGTNSNDFGALWNVCYEVINTLNGVLKFGPDAQMDATRKKQFLAQAKFLRAFSYYHLVITFGDVPLHLEFIDQPLAADSRQPIAQVYDAIIKDLQDAAADLPNIPEANTGKPATKPTALYLLSKTYLARGWSSAAKGDDFQNAYTTAKNLIDTRATYNIGLHNNYGDANKKGGEYGQETLLVIDHNADTKYGEYTLNSFASGNKENKTNFFFRPNYPTVNANYPAAGGNPVIDRDILNGRPFIRIRPNYPYAMEVAFADKVNDARYDRTFQTHWITNRNTVTPRGTLIPNVDTAIWMPGRLVTAAERNAFKGIIFEPPIAGATTPYTAIIYPSMKKYDDSTRAYLNDASARPFIMYKFSEVYLIAAEAAFKLSDLTNAAAMLNVLRQRAAVKPGQTPAQLSAAIAAQTITPAQVTLDFILDERSRELYGEHMRWWDLVRTKTLVDRVKKYNTEAAAGIKETHMLRPIPQQQIDLVTEGPKFPQNPGY
ncbi:MAG: RagB/SusD family nutrient uptake outer membrane protein [Chitinophagaceae bacterium]